MEIKWVVLLTMAPRFVGSISESALNDAFERFAAKAISALDAQNGRSFRPVVLSPEVVSEFLVPQILQASSAKNIRLGRSHWPTS